jgi:pimeloyl-ACP methyl ester carboxylesterase
MASVGLYDPNAFGRAAPFALYALEEELEYKIPIVFVHGLHGSPRDFAALVANLDRGRFKPWFFYYPSGRALDDSAQLFYELFLSGSVVPPTEMPMLVVAHDMGGLIVREALNAYDAAGPEVRLCEVITISTPYGGYRSTTLELAEATLSAPVWRDLDPSSRFMRELFRKPLPASLEHAALYTYLQREQLERGSADDGVVEVASQLYPPARVEFTRLVGFRVRHGRLLSDRTAIHWLIAEIEAAAGPAADERPAHLAATQP